MILKEVVLVIREIKYKDYYESKSIAHCKSTYTCDCYGGIIKEGSPCDVHTSYSPESTKISKFKE